jgi:hypothetical protein
MGTRHTSAVEIAQAAQQASESRIFNLSFDEWYHRFLAAGRAACEADPDGLFNVVTSLLAMGYYVLPGCDIYRILSRPDDIVARMRERHGGSAKWRHSEWALGVLAGWQTEARRRFPPPPPPCTVPVTDVIIKGPD